MWCVYLQDTNGCRRAMALGLSEIEANRFIQRILEAQNKPHKVDYFKVEYPNDKKIEFLGNLRINI